MRRRRTTTHENAFSEDTPFGQLKALPRSGKPILKHCDWEDAALYVANEIREIVLEIAQAFKSQSSSPLDRESSHAFLPPDTLLSSSNAEIEDRSVSQDFNSLVESIGQLSRNMQFMDSEESFERLIKWLDNSPEVVNRFKGGMEVIKEFWDRFVKKGRWIGDNHATK